MSMYRLGSLFAPRSVALIGASEREGSLGRVILRNLRNGGFDGTIHLVNPRYATIDGAACTPRIEDLPEIPDLNHVRFESSSSRGLGLGGPAPI